VLTVPGDPRRYVLPPAGTDLPRPRAPGPAAPAPEAAAPVPPVVPVVVPAGGRLARLGRAAAAGAGVVTVVGLGLGGALLVATASLLRWFGARHLDVTGQLFLVALILFTGHGLVTRWSVRARPVRWWAVLLGQLPFLAGYAAGVAWYLSRQPFVRETGFPPWYALGAAAAPGAVVALVFWYLRDPRSPRRALAFLAAVGTVVALSGAGVVALSWRATNGYGLVGPPTPWAAFTALTATSCLSPNDFYSFGDKLVQASCPTGPAADPYAGSYDTARFDDLVCGGQPKAAFAPWWQHSRDYQVAIELDFGGEAQWGTVVDGVPAPVPLPASYGGGTATMSVRVRLQAALHFGGTTAVESHPMANDRPAETWLVALAHQSLGGWKVCRIDVVDPIQVSRR